MHPQGSAPQPREVLPDPEASRLGLRALDTRLGRVYLSERSWPLTATHGSVVLGEALEINEPARARLALAVGGEGLTKAAFIDIETTGLSGGTGTYAFLVGVGTVEGETFLLRQFFLADPASEAPMLAAISAVVAGCNVIVSFNGRRFDLPILETRHILNRLRPSALALPHLDLLFPARALYRSRLPSCRLIYLEQSLLAVHRQDDVPGWLIPSLYFEYARQGDVAPLEPVFRHNAMDILSLVALLGHLARVAGGETPAEPLDCLAVALWDERAGRLDEAVSLYERVMLSPAPGHGRLTAQRRLQRLYRRMQRWQDLRLMLGGAARTGGLVERLEASVALAKLEEHRFRDYCSAEAATREALAIADVIVLTGGPAVSPFGLQLEALHRRLHRLRVKQAGQRPSRRMPAPRQTRDHLLEPSPTA